MSVDVCVYVWDRDGDGDGDGDGEMVMVMAMVVVMVTEFLCVCHTTTEALGTVDTFIMAKLFKSSQPMAPDPTRNTEDAANCCTTASPNTAR